MIVSGGQQRDSAIYIHVSILPQTPQPSRIPQNTEQSSLCYTVGPHWLFILNTAVCTCPSQTPCLLILTLRGCRFPGWEMKPREVTKLAEGLIVCQWQSWDLNLYLSALSSSPEYPHCLPIPRVADEGRLVASLAGRLCVSRAWPSRGGRQGSATCWQLPGPVCPGLSPTQINCCSWEV